MSAIGDTHAAQTDERAAIARVATLVAMDAEPADVFAAVSREVHRLFELGPDPVEMAGVIRFEPGPMHIAVGLSRDLGAFSVGARWAPEEPCALSAVRRTGRSARIEEAAVAAAAGAHPSAHESGEVNRRITQLASPIVVNGELWGAISVKTLNDVPDDAEARLEKFAELTAMAITRLRTNPTLTEVVREQAALRRVAALVAGGVPFQAVFSAVCEEVGVLLDADAAALVAPADGAMSIVASWSSSEPFAKGGAPWPLTPGSVAARVIETGRPARSEGPVELDGWIGDVARRMGLQTTVGAPITVGGKLWGALVVSTRREAAWTDQTEHRLVAFTNLIAMAISNAESARQLEHVAAEQAALRRVATLVARGASSGEVADVVAAEVGTLLDSDSTIVVRCDGDGTVEAIATWSDNPAWVIPVGTSRPAGGPESQLALTMSPTRRGPSRNSAPATASRPPLPHRSPWPAGSGA
jgi:GAF domain-containing protein